MKKLTLTLAFILAPLAAFAQGAGLNLVTTPPTGSAIQLETTSPLNVGITAANLATWVGTNLGAITAVGNTAITGTVTSTYTSTSATPSTVRAIRGNATVGAGLAMTAGNLVGARGEVNLPTGTSSTGGTSFLYGAQGKAVLAGTLGAAAQTAGLVGQVDVSTLTANDATAVTSAAWIDMGATASAGFIATPGTSQILRLTNTTAAIIPQAIFVEAYSTNLMEVHSTGEGEAWHSATCTPGAVTGGTGGLRITLDGVTKWIPLAATCS